RVDPSLLDSLPSGATVVVDTAPVIYLLEDNSRYLSRFLPLFRAAERREVRILITPITVAEVLAGPIKARKEALASRYEHALREGLGWQVADLTADLACQAARLRIRYRLKLPDAFQLAAALVHSCEALVTHDRDFGEARREVPILGLDEH
ncbi:MAG TPA: PIN domain-containing protein, partial [Fibrobacteria bacterium]|nr:PIN domain-containing protein [Fibrobacteria bacterium]